MSVYHTPLIIRMTLEFTNWIFFKAGKEIFLRTTKQALRAERLYVHFKDSPY